MTKEQHPTVIVDTNALWGDHFLTSKPWTQLRRLAEEGLIRLVVPRVVIMEATRQWSEGAAESLQHFRDARHKVDKHFRGLESVAKWSLKQGDPDLKVDDGQYEDRLTAILAEANARFRRSQTFPMRMFSSGISRGGSPLRRRARAIGTH